MTSFSLFTGLTPQGVGSDPNDYELATKFRSSEDGLITGLRYYRILEDSGDVDERTLTLWNISGAPLVSLTISSGVGDVGWQVGSLPIPIQITGGELYIVSYGYDDDGVDDAYAFTGSFFDFDYNAPGGFLSAPASGQPLGLSGGGIGNGLFAEVVGAFPQQSFNANNYFADVLWVVCFLPGTLIATPTGEQPIESLQPGDLICTAEGPQPVKFLCHTRRHRNALLAIGKMPVQLSAGALGELGPRRDTFMSPSHAIHLDGHLVEAGALLNDGSIRQLDPEEGPEFFTYYNIELEAHSLIWANGLQTETYFANCRGIGFTREDWDNYGDYIALYGSSELMPELAMPRIPFARLIPAELRRKFQLHEMPLFPLDLGTTASLIDQVAA